MAAALKVIRRDGVGVPMATIADEAAVGVGTLYRHFAGRTELLDELTVRSFELVLGCATDSDRPELIGRECLRLFYLGTIDHRDQLVLPLHGGPSALSSRARDAQKRVHSAVRRIIARGISDGSVRPDTTVWDVIGFGALLAQPLQAPNWKSTGRRMAEIYLAGLSA